MRYVMVVLLLMLSGSGVAQTNKLPYMTVLDGYVDIAGGSWEPKGTFSAQDIEITCVRGDMSKYFGSQKGYCLLAYAFPINGHPAVKTEYLDILSWEKTRIIAEHNKAWEAVECESQTYVIDFPTNTVTLASTLNKTTKNCIERYAKLDAMGKEKGRPTLKDNDVFHLVPGDIDMTADKSANPFLK